MRKLILSVNASLDGFVAGTDGDMSWMVEDDEMDHEFTTALRRRADTMLAGRATYESFEAAWPGIARSPDLSPEMAAFARWMLETPIVVFSRGEPTLAMPNARLAARPRWRSRCAWSAGCPPPTSPTPSWSASRRWRPG